MKLVAALGITGLVLVAVLYVRFWDDVQGLKPVILEAPLDIATSLNDTDIPLTLPDGFHISILADDVPGARVLAQDKNGDLWVSQKSEGKILRLDLEDGEVVDRIVELSNLNTPHGIAFDPENPSVLYFAEEDKISKINISKGELPIEVVSLPSGVRHSTRTLVFGADGRLYVSIGSSCDVCEESEEKFGSIWSLEKDGSDFKIYASGLRNTVFFTVNDLTGQLWGTDMGRDNLGDDLPPDEINIITEGGDYGWPYCYGDNIQDEKFSPVSVYGELCNDTIPSKIDLQAHSAPLGLDFVPEDEGWPEKYWHDLFVAYHGSWNRTEPTGYKIMRFQYGPEGILLWQEDLISGWLTEDDRSIGRPVDILILPGGLMYISDDKAGVIYKIEVSG